jgi:hypothetical protein
MKELDQLYGIVVRPARKDKRPNGYDDWELDTRPASFSILDATSAVPLRAFMTHVAENWAFGSVFVKRAVILYLVDESGLLRYSIEEAVDDNAPGRDSGRPYKRLEIPYLKGFLRTDKKLGHPALVDCGGARIAGQIMFQPEDETGRAAHWTIDARSGRYGRTVNSARRESRHVDNVISMFGRYKIELKNAFGPP